MLLKTQYNNHNFLKLCNYSTKTISFKIKKIIVKRLLKLLVYVDHVALLKEIPELANIEAPIMAIDDRHFDPKKDLDELARLLANDSSSTPNKMEDIQRDDTLKMKTSIEDPPELELKRTLNSLGVCLYR